MQIQGMNPNGTRNLAYPVLLDVDNLIEYMQMIFLQRRPRCADLQFLRQYKPKQLVRHP